MRVALYDRAGERMVLPRPELLVPRRYSWHALGGPEFAEIEVGGSLADLWEAVEWLRCGVEIHDRRAEPVWWGYVAEVDVRVGSVVLGVSLDSMANRVAGIYGNGWLTSWYQDADSQAAYGVKELLESIPDSDLALPDNLARMVLAERRLPVPTVRVGEPGEPTARLICRGWWGTLGWRYYEQTNSASTATTTQISDIVTAVGAFLTGVDVETASGISGSRYREGTRTALDVILDLLAVGVSGGRRLLASVTQGRRLRVYQEPAPGDADWHIDADGRLWTQHLVPVEPHTCPVAMWARLRDVIPATANVARLANPSLLFVERSEYDAARGQLLHEARDMPSPWNLPEIEE